MAMLRSSHALSAWVIKSEKLVLSTMNIALVKSGAPRDGTLGWLVD
jgi:hypothetical protein